MSDFFEPPPRPRVVIEPAPPNEWDGPPRGVVPAVVPIERVVGCTEEVGIYLACFWVYPAGFEFDVFVAARDESVELDPFSFGHQYRAEETGEIPPTQLRLGLMFADGAKATNTGERFDWDGEFGSPPKAPVMSSTRGSGGGGDWSQSFWAWPIPPAGPLEFVCEWPAAGIELTRSELDSAAIIEAASRTQAIFPPPS